MAYKTIQQSFAKTIEALENTGWKEDSKDNTLQITLDGKLIKDNEIYMYSYATINANKSRIFEISFSFQEKSKFSDNHFVPRDLCKATLTQLPHCCGIAVVSNMQIYHQQKGIGTIFLQEIEEFLKYLGFTIVLNTHVIESKIYSYQ